MNKENNNIILFDGVCNLCNGIVKFIIRRDPKARFKFSAMQSETGINFLKKFNLPAEDIDTFVYIRNDSAFVRSTAALYVLRDLGKFWKIFFGLIIIPKCFRDFIYNRIAKSRYKLWGKKDSCMIPTPEIKERFID